MHLKVWSASEIYRQLLTRVAPLPSQREYAQELCELLAIHMNRCSLIGMGIGANELPMQSAIVVASTGTGKTYLLRQLCDALGIGLIAIAADSLAREGWKGSSLSQQLLAAKEHLTDEQFANAVIFVDEIDKLALDNGHRGDAAPNLLQLFNGGNLVLEKSSDGPSETVDTTRWCVLMAGAFVGLDNVIEKRLMPKQGIGFGAVQSRPAMSRADLLRQVTNQDLVQYGMMEELLGRVACILSIPSPQLDDYRQLLSLKKGTLPYQYRQYMSYVYGVGVKINESAVYHIASRCMQSGTGARAIAPHIHSAMHSALQQVEQDKTISKVVLDGDGVTFVHGPRNQAVVFFRQSTRERKIKVITSTSAQRLASILCTGYRRAGGNMHHVDELHAFLTCSIYYLLHCLPNGQCDMASLAKLANTLKEAPKGGRSTYDIMCTDAASKPDECGSYFLSIYGKYVLRSRKRTPQRIPAAIQLIWDRLRKEYNVSDVQLVLEVPKNDTD